MHFRFLNLVCKTFKFYLDHSRPNLWYIQYARHTHDDNSLRPRAYYIPIIIASIKEKPLQLKTWPALFQYFQRFVLGNIDDNFHHKTLNYHEETGKFWLNPSLNIGDLNDLFRDDNHYKPNHASLLLLLEQLHNCEDLEEYNLDDYYPRYGIRMSSEWYWEVWKNYWEVNLVREYMRKPYVVAVRAWQAHGDPQLSGANIAPDVAIWWLWRDQEVVKTRVVGYHQGRAWVFDLINSELFTNFEPSEEVVGFGAFVEGEISYQRYWGSSYSGPGKGVVPESTFREYLPDPETIAQITPVEFWI
jgi:hypothetical protein